MDGGKARLQRAEHGDVDLLRLHGECVAAPPDIESAMAPHRYVVCASAPDRPEDEAAWRAQPVSAEGTGRPG